MAAEPAEFLAGLLLVFFLPGFGVVVATFPEWSYRGRGALERGLTTLTLAVVLSVALTVLVGYGLLALSPSGFAASWSDPTLEIILGLIAAIGLGIGGVRRAFPKSPVPEDEPGGLDPYALTRELDRLQREYRKIRRGQLPARGAPEASDPHRQLEALESEIRRIEAELERAYVE